MDPELRQKSGETSEQQKNNNKTSYTEPKTFIIYLNIYIVFDKLSIYSNHFWYEIIIRGKR